MSATARVASGLAWLPEMQITTAVVAIGLAVSHPGALRPRLRLADAGRAVWPGWAVVV